MTEVVIVDAVRTPIGRVGGVLSAVRPDDMVALVLQAIVARTGLDPAEVEEVYMGCANQAGEDNRNVARMGTLLAGFPHEVAAVTHNRLCASGLNAVNQAARAILAGEGDVYIAGGVESMSRGPYAIPKSAGGWPVGNLTAWDSSFGWRFPNPKMEAMFPLEAMGATAENIYEQVTPRITREEQDAFAYESQRRAVEAINTGRFAEEIAPVEIPQRRGDPLVVAHDEHPRYRWEGEIAVLDTTPEKLAKLRPVFREGGSVTAGNASGLNDGAAAVLLMSAEKAAALGLRPLARYMTSAAAGVDPRLMGLGPIPATRKALQRAGLSIEQIDLIELNEAFAVQSLAVMRELGLRPEITNVNGGAIALGHPLGCSGARILTTLLHEMKRRKAAGEAMRYGLATLCVGVGQGEATIIEML
ncbi:MAG: acetyl-CoA C-acetyltransferase [Anaerolineae bacterium]|nr:acetyl-CoA C-acetyltransferase [Anaerolineae bacterium]